MIREVRVTEAFRMGFVTSGVSSERNDSEW